MTWEAVGSGQWPVVREVLTSAVTGEGIGELRGEILRHIGGEAGAGLESRRSRAF